MPDDDEKIVRLSDVKSAFGEARQRRMQDDDIKTISSTKEAIEYLNKVYGTIVLNGKFKVLHEKDDSVIEFMEKKDFVNNLDHMRLLITNVESGQPKSTPMTDIWFRSPSRRMYSGIIFDPSRQGHYDDLYNLWKGYRYSSIERDCSIFTDYMRDVICSGNVDNYNFLVALISQMFQHPHQKPGIAVVMRGDEGVGKSFFIEKLGALMGEYYFKTSNPAYIFGDHNGQLKNKLLLHLEEAVWAGSKKDESLLKDLITGSTIEINDKYVPVYSVPNHLHLFITGNPDWLVSASFKARRMFALHVSEAHIRDTQYFKEIDEWFRHGGAEALMHYFMNYKTDIDLRLAPITDELVFQKQQSMNGVQEWFYSIADTKEMPYGELDKPTGKVRVIKKLLYLDYSHSAIGRRIPLSDRKFGIAFTSLLPNVINGKEQKDSNGYVDTIIETNNVKIKDSRDIRRDGYIIPDLVMVRKLLEFKLGGKVKWTDDESEDVWTVLHGNTDFDFSIYRPDR